MTTAVIAAAGAGTRLGALAAPHSKAMVPIAGRPLIDWALVRVRAAGIERALVVAHAQDIRLIEHLRNAHAGVGIAIQQERRGIADAICRALPQLGGEAAYLACACDSLFVPDEIAALVARGQSDPEAAVVGVLAMTAADTVARSAVRLDGERVAAIVEKPPPGASSSGLVAAPLYWLPRALDPHLAGAPEGHGERFVTSALAAFIAGGGMVRAVLLSERIEVTTPADVERATRLLSGA